jgi:hypothetical protein
LIESLLDEAPKAIIFHVYLFFNGLMRPKGIYLDIIFSVEAAIFIQGFLGVGTLQVVANTVS